MARAEEKAQAERERFTQMVAEEQECENERGAWEIERVRSGPDQGKPCAYYGVQPSTKEADMFRGTEEELLVKYPELTGRRY